MSESDPPAGALTYDPEIGPGYFVQTRTDFLRHEGFTPLAKLLYQVLLSYCGAGDTAWPGMARLAAHCAVGETSLRQAMKDLQAAGLVTVTRRGLNYTNLYHVHKLPLIIAATKEARNPRIKTVESAGSKPVRSTAKVQSAQTHSAETERATTENARTAFAATIRFWCKAQHWPPPTRGELAALWATQPDAEAVQAVAVAQGARSLAEVIGQLGEG